MADLSRRMFLARAAAVSSASLATGTVASAQGASEAAAPLVCVFSKHLQFIQDYEELAQTYRDLELDGADLTVRGGGHVEPERVEEDLPRCAEAFDAVGLPIAMITTRLADGRDPHCERILSAASKLGIKYFRCGGGGYNLNQPIMPQLEQITRAMGRLAEAAEAHGMVGGFHNHSGRGRVGAPLWDLHHIYTEVGSDALGSNFDVGHATIEGAYGAWEINAKLLAPHTKMMAAKDFVWDRAGGVDWAPLGRGLVDLPGMLRIFRDEGFAGPISMHFEYRIQNGEPRFKEIREARQVLREAMKEAGYVLT